MKKVPFADRVPPRILTKEEEDNLLANVKTESEKLPPRIHSRQWTRQEVFLIAAAVGALYLTLLERWSCGAH